jgi:hypothetical protein
MCFGIEMNARKLVTNEKGEEEGQGRTAEKLNGMGVVRILSSEVSESVMALVALMRMSGKPESGRVEFKANLRCF